LSPAAINSQQVFHPITAEKVAIERIYWTNADFTGKTFSGCDGYVVDPTTGTEECESCTSSESSSYEHYADGNGRLIYQNGQINFEADFTWSVDSLGFYDGPMPVLAFAEITPAGINQWIEGKVGRVGFYQHCAGLTPSLSNEQSESVTNGGDDNNTIVDNDGDNSYSATNIENSDTNSNNTENITGNDSTNSNAVTENNDSDSNINNNDTDNDASANNTSNESSTNANTSAMDLTQFVTGALASSNIVECTLADGTQTQCYELVTTGTAKQGDSIGPFCPRTVTTTTDDTGIWPDDSSLYEVDGDFILNLPNLYGQSYPPMDQWIMYDNNGNVRVTDTPEACEAATRPNIDPVFYGYCVECSLDDLQSNVSKTFLGSIRRITRRISDCCWYTG